MATDPTTVYTTIQHRSDTAAGWTFYNPVLAVAEPGVELPAVAGVRAGMKIGDGVTAWLDLPYAIAPGGTVPPVLADIVQYETGSVNPVLLPTSGEVIICRPITDATATPVTIQPSVDGQTIEGGASWTIDVAGGSVHLIMDQSGTNWQRI